MRLSLAAYLLIASACTRDPASQDHARAAPKSASRQVDPSKELTPLLARLNYEALHRPATGPKAEAVFDALDHANIGVVQRKQYLGVMMHAKYCLGGKTREGAVIAVCEYDSPAAALAGKKFMDEQFASMAPMAKRAVQGGDVLTVTDPYGAAGSPVVARADDIFAALLPH